MCGGSAPRTRARGWQATSRRARWWSAMGRCRVQSDVCAARDGGSGEHRACGVLLRTEWWSRRHLQCAAPRLAASQAANTQGKDHLFAPAVCTRKREPGRLELFCISCTGPFAILQLDRALPELARLSLLYLIMFPWAVLCAIAYSLPSMPAFVGQAG